MAEDNLAALLPARRLDDEERRWVANCLAKDGLSLPSDRFAQLIRDVEASMAAFAANARGQSFRKASDGAAAGAVGVPANESSRSSWGTRAAPARRRT